MTTGSAMNLHHDIDNYVNKLYLPLKEGKYGSLIKYYVQLNYWFRSLFVKLCYSLLVGGIIVYACAIMFTVYNSGVSDALALLSMSLLLLIPAILKYVLVQYITYLLFPLVGVFVVISYVIAITAVIIPAIIYGIFVIFNLHLILSTRA
jgi:hypothetical protein